MTSYAALTATEKCIGIDAPEAPEGVSTITSSSFRYAGEGGVAENNWPAAEPDCVTVNAASVVALADTVMVPSAVVMAPPRMPAAFRSRQRKGTRI
jgi:hypothetical protein